MKTDDLVAMLAGGILLYVAYMTMTSKPGTAGVNLFKPSGQNNTIWPKEINVGNTMLTPADGWRYFTDGTAISPGGDYYYQGELVWKQP